MEVAEQEGALTSAERMVVGSSEFWAAIAGAIVGAVVAGVIAAALQLASLRAAKKQRDDDRAEIRKATARAALLKMRRIHSNLHGLHAHVRECQADAAAEQNAIIDEPWKMLRPVVNPGDRERFSPEEASLVMSLGDDELTNGLITIDDVHNRAWDAFALYTTKRAALLQQLPDAEMIRGMVGALYMHPHQAVQAQVSALRAETNQLGHYVIEHAPKDDEAASALLDKLVAALRTKLGMQVSLTTAKVASSAASKTPV